MADSISPSALKAVRRDEREAWRTYEGLRRAALDAGKAYRAKACGVLAHEDALYAAVEARRWAWILTRRREQFESLPVEAHGGRVSPAALERLRRNGRLK